MSAQIDYELKLKKLQLLEEKIKIREGLPHRYAFKRYHWQASYQANRSNKRRLICAANQIGKVQPDTCWINTPDGRKLYGDIKEGDYIFGSDGKPCLVKNVFIHKNWSFNKITFSDGAITYAGDEHLWICKGYKQRFRKKYTYNFDRSSNKGDEFANPDYDKWVVKSTKDIVSDGRYSPLATAVNRHVIPVAASVEYEGSDLFDPYLIGLLIGDGSVTGSIVLTTADGQISNYIKDNYDVAETGKYGFRIRKITDNIRSAGIFGSKCATKFIPDPYLVGNFNQRLHLLRGLMDTDGAVTKSGSMSYCTISKRLKDDFVRLVSSLGGMCRVKSRVTKYTHNGELKEGKLSYNVSIYIGINPFELERKRARFRIQDRYKHERVIESIEYSHDADGRCIVVDNDDSSYLIGDEFIVTHNSSIQICDRIEVATNPSLWPGLWPAIFTNNPKAKPYSWYLYPNQDTVMTEFLEKWEPDFLPRGEYKDDPVYGWKHHIVNKVLKKITFNSGYTIYFKTYNQNVMDLQSGTIYAIDLDEEVDIELLPELEARLYATDGYISMAFTATKGQEFWRQVIEGKGPEEKWPTAWKVQVSMYDCLEYADCTKTVWTRERIKRIEDGCVSNNVRLRRVFGRFIKDTGLLFHGFDRRINYKPYPKTSRGTYFKGCPKGWTVYSAVDYGSGGESNHPSAYSFMVIDPTLTKIRWIRGRRMDKIETSVGDLFSAYKGTRGGLETTMQSYDFAGNDFGMIATRAGESWEKAKKDHALGEGAVNTAFKSGMLVIYYDPDDEQDESIKLVHELESLSIGYDKRRALDDLTDTVRYTLMSMPVDWEAMYGEGDSRAKRDGPKKGSAEEVRPWVDRKEEEYDTERIGNEINEWNDLY